MLLQPALQLKAAALAHPQAPSETPGRVWSGGEATPAGGSRWDAAEPGAAAQPKRNRWDATPTPGHGFGAGPSETPAGGKRSRWDATPAMVAGGATPAYGAAGMGATPAWGAMGATPAGGLGMETPTPGMVSGGRLSAVAQSTGADGMARCMPHAVVMLQRMWPRGCNRPRPRAPPPPPCRSWRRSRRPWARCP